MAKRRLEKGFKVPGENEGFFDYMLRRATQGGYDKRDEPSPDSADEENLSGNETQANNSSKTKKPKSPKKSSNSNSSASKVASDDVVGNDSFSVISAIQTMSNVLGIKLDDIKYGIKNANQELGSINEYSEDSAIWLKEIYDLLDTNEKIKSMEGASGPDAQKLKTDNAIAIPPEGGG